MSDVLLTWVEVIQAAQVGVFRQVRACRKGRVERHGEPRQRGPWEIQIEGAAAEMAVAKALGMYWADSTELDYNGDVGRYHVRSSDLADAHLLLYPTDPDEACFILVTGRAPLFHIRGWIVAAEGKVDAYRANGRLRSDGWMVPADVLWSIKDLP